MISTSLLLQNTHLLGLILAVGAATVKLALLLKCRGDHAFAPAFVQASKTITRLIITGLVLLTLSGIGWLVLLSVPFTPRLGVKLVFVAAVWVIGPVIDNFAEPRFAALVAEAPSPAYRQALGRTLALEALATGLFYVILVYWLFC